jgi:Transposase DDE domain
MKIRVVKTASNAKAVQAVQYQNSRRIVVKHFGSCHTDEQLDEMLLVAKEWLNDYAGQLSIFPDNNPNSVLHVNHCTFLGVYYTFFYDLISEIQRQIGFEGLCHPILNDLVTMRIFEPASKLRSLELLEGYFGVVRQRKTYYKIASGWLTMKDELEAKVVEFATKTYAFDFELVFYDVTTLYFETFEEDELRKNGFSKDSKSQQPQILVALMVSKEGFPIAYEVFPGNTFEGKTIIPAIKALVDKYAVQSFTVVADAAMISSSNIKELLNHKLNYIVGARLGNLSGDMIEQIDQMLPRKEGHTIRIKTDNGDLICSYSSVRYRKDKYEMEKQIEKAMSIIEKRAKNRMVKFTKANNKEVELNEALIQKTKKLLGIKGYYTNLEISTADDHTIIRRYHELYKIEQAFRVSKNDLQTRPIFHYKEQPIKMHILVCFMALVIAKHIELQTGDSTRKFITECKKVSDGRLMNHITGKEIRLKGKITPKTAEYLAKLTRPH